MKLIPVTLLSLMISIFGLGQTAQISFGTSTKTETFLTVKYDPSDGSTVHIGSVNDPSSGTGNDCFIVKFNSLHQVVWQKYISNPGDDYFNQIVIASNGDYIVTGIYVQGGIFRGIVCRFNGSNGNTIWSNTSASTNSPSGDKFYDIYETSNHNIAVVGVTNFSSGQTNSLIVLLNSGGSLIWSKVSNFPNSDEFYTVNQLSNGNLILGSFYSTGSNYNPVVIELDESNGAVVSQTYYTVSINIPGGPSGQNSIWPFKCLIKNNIVFFECYLFQGFNGTSYHCIYTYDETTKNLSGNLYYHTGVSTATGFSFYPIANNDILISQSYSTPPVSAFISRVTNGSVVFDRKINGNINAIYGIDVLNTKIALTGIVTNTDVDAYNLFSTSSVPLESAPCNIVNSNTLFLQASNLTATNTNVINLNPIIVLNANTLSNNNTGYSLNNICGCTIATISNGPTDVTLCGTGNAVFSITAGNAVTFQWQVNTGSGWADVTNAGLYSGATTNSLTVTAANLTLNNYQYRCIAASPCSNVISTVANLIVNTAVTPLLSIVASANTICAGTPVTFTATPTNGGISPQYQWKKNASNVGTNNSTYTDNTLNNVDVISCVLTSSINCVSSTTATSNSINMVVNAVLATNMRYPTVNAVINQPAQLQARDIAGGSYIWSPSLGLNNANIKNPLFMNSQQQEYLIHISSVGNCDIVDTLLVKVITQGKGIYVPQAFTPNADGNNDRLYPILVGIAELKYFKVFNRWGNLLFETKDPNPAKGWDGRYKGFLQPVESYTWIAEGVDIDGVTIKKTGNTLLIK